MAVGGTFDEFHKGHRALLIMRAHRGVEKEALGTFTKIGARYQTDWPRIMLQSCRHGPGNDEGWPRIKLKNLAGTSNIIKVLREMSRQNWMEIRRNQRTTAL